MTHPFPVSEAEQLRAENASLRGENASLRGEIDRAHRERDNWFRLSEELSANLAIKKGALSRLGDALKTANSDYADLAADFKAAVAEVMSRLTQVTAERDEAQAKYYALESTVAL